ncbi:MAG: hypothetical protein DRJ55_01535 [Thermoprotei archaeon]|nr:MAG: hypothetical protein DRJ55_01535 [Thermoprotei archaeon]
MDELRLLCFSDVHGKVDIVEYFVEELKKKTDKIKFDVIVAAGDINNPQKPWTFTEIMSKLAELGKPVFYVKGNWDVNLPAQDVVGVADLEKIAPIKIKGITLVGHGRKTKPFQIDHDSPVILVTHYPPFSIMDKGKKLNAPRQTQHSGLIEINYLIQYYKPIVHIFGHSHSYGGVDWKIGDTLYVNVARLDRVAKNGKYIGNYCILEVSPSKKLHIKWFFLNGSWKKCSGCGRLSHLPPGWTLCRKCASRRDLRFESLPSQFSKLHVKVSIFGENKALLNETVNIPLKTLANKEAYNDFVEKIILDKLSQKLQSRYEKILILSKDKVVEFYGNKNDGIIVPFSELLFSCNPKIYGEKLCTLMRLFSKDKRVHVLWGIRDKGTLTIESEYVLISRDLIHSATRDVGEAVRKGFSLLVLEKQLGSASSH